MPFKDADRQRAYWRKYREAHRAERAEYDRQREPRPEYMRDYVRNRSQHDVEFRLKHVLRMRLYHALKGGTKAGSAIKDLGCSAIELVAHLEAQFKSGMTWMNWGIGVGKWQVDHVRPLASFDLTDREQFLQACHYTNLQPLWSHENLQKGAKHAA